MVVPITKRFGVAGPSGALFGTKKQQVARDPRPSDLKPKPIVVTTTSPLAQPKDDSSNQYSGQPKPLSAEAIRALGMKRLAADQAYQQAMAGESSGVQRFQASFNAAKEKLSRAARNTTEETARRFAGRGLARNPMQMGRAAREIESSLQENIGEAKFTLTTEIEALKLATEQARIERDKILADIELEEALLRSSPDLYFQGA